MSAILLERYKGRNDVRRGRPWWRVDWEAERVVRSDGISVPMPEFEDWYKPDDPALLVMIDETHPIPEPKPECRQVWVWPDGEQAMITRVDATGRAWAGSALFSRWSSSGSAVLVGGPGSPWADTRPGMTP